MFYATAMAIQIRRTNFFAFHPGMSSADTLVIAHAHVRAIRINTLTFHGVCLRY